MSKKILIVEDEPIVSLDMNRALTKKGYAVVATIPRGEEAMKSVNELEPDIILMDIILQGEMDGIDTVEQIKSHHDIPIIYVTAHSDEATLSRAKATEPHGYVIKPINQKELITAIELAFYKHEMDMVLKASEEKHRLLLKNAGIGIGYYDTKGKIILFNNIAAAYHQGEPKDFKGKTLAEVYGKEASKKYMKRIDTAVKTRETHEYEDFVSLETGDKWFASTYTAIPDAKGKTMGVQIISHDITSRKTYEDELQKKREELETANEELQAAIEELESQNEDLMEANEVLSENESMLRNLFEASIDGVFLESLNGNILECNSRACEMYGYTKEEMINLSVKELIPEEDRDKIPHIIDEELEKGGIHINARALRKDGTVFDAEVSTRLIRSRSRQMVVAFIRDITHR
jgi:PAS domain S-box-containing protein